MMNVNQLDTYFSNIQKLGALLQSTTSSFGGNKKKQILAEIDANKRSIADGKFFYSQADGFHLVIDMFGGDVYHLDMEGYTYTINGQALSFTNVETEEETTVVTFFGYLNIGSVPLRKGYTYLSGHAKRLQDELGSDWFEGYPAVRFREGYKTSLRVHWVIALMEYGFDIVSECIGEKRDRKYDVHHKESYRKTKSNSIKNLQIMDTKSHEELHGFFWKKFN